MKKEVLFVLALFVGSSAVAQWESDRRLTFSGMAGLSLFTGAWNVAISGDTVHVVWSDGRDGNSEIYYKRSTNGGDIWGPDTRLTNDSAGSYEPTVAALGPIIHVAWYDTRSGGANIYYKRSTDGGNTWGSDILFSNAFSPSVAASGSNVHVVWHGIDLGAWVIFYRRSTDCGMSWQPIVQISDFIPLVSDNPSVAASTTDVHVVWRQWRGGNDSDIYYRRSTNGGVTWEPVTQLTFDPNRSEAPSVAVSGTNVHVVWHDCRENAEIHYKRSSNRGASWSDDIRLTYDSAASWEPSVATSGQMVHTVWFDERDGGYRHEEIYYKRSTDGGTTWPQDDVRLTNDPAMSWGPSVAISGAGVHVVLNDTRTGGSEIYYKRNPTGNLPLFSISGYTKYYWTPYRPVPNTEMFLTGGKVDTILTDSGGYYIFDSIPGLLNYTVTPQKTNTLRDQAVSSLDAAWILQYVVGTRTFIPQQQIAADVSGDGQIRSYDAALVLQYVVGIIQHFPAGDWKFDPTSRTYFSLNSNQVDQDYAAIFLGDVTGNWQPILELKVLDIVSDNLAGYGGNLSISEGKTEFRMQNVQNIQELGKSQNATSERIVTKEQAQLQNTEYAVFPIRIPDAKDAISADIVLTYNPNEIAIKEVTLGNSTEDYLIAWTNDKGIVRIGLAGTTTLNGGVELAKVFYQKAKENENEAEEKKETVEILESPNRLSSVVSRLEQLCPIQIHSVVLNEEPIITKTTNEGSAGSKTELPTQFSLMPNQPNPFNAQTVIRYGLPIAGKVSFQIFNVTGTLVNTLINETQDFGYYSIRWDGDNDKKQEVPSGIYFYEIKIANFTARKKMIKVKE